MNFKTEITNLHYNRKNNLPNWLKTFLVIGSVGYGLVTAIRNLLYDRYILPIDCVGAKVISVGNLTTGGVGKTPVVANIANYFAKNEKERVCIISRGYGGHLDNKEINIIKQNGKILFDAYYAGDEPYWLSENTMPNVIVLTCANRVKACNFAVNELGATKIVLDDAFQHRKIHRDVDIVLVDSEMRFGNEKVLPLGPLREFQSGIKRADVIYVVSKNTNHTNAINYAKSLAKKYRKDVRICRVEPDKIYNIKTGKEFNRMDFAVAVCAIGQPEQFFQFLDGCKIAKTVTFEDHHTYTREDISSLRSAIITTEKDAVKIKHFGFQDIYALKLKTELDLEGIFD